MKKVLDLNFYELLEIAFDVSPFEIRRAYKEMIQLYHGDSLASYSFFPREEREEILAKLDEAYSTLIDEKKRSRYDQLLIEQGIFEEGMQYRQDRKTRLPCLRFRQNRKPRKKLRQRKRKQNRCLKEL